MKYLLYGATGYSGGLILERCLARGLRPVVAGRSEAVRALAESHGLEARVMALEDGAALWRGLEGIEAVLHCAGPFSRTSKPMADACIAVRAHYLDITGEIAVFEALAARNGEAQAARVMLLPGVGFDVVPSDCLAAHLKRRLPDATWLMLAFESSSGLSRGTATTLVENVARGGLIRRGGKLVPVPAAWRTRRVDFGGGPVEVTSIPWGDIATAWYSTGIPDIEVYTRMSAGQRWLLVATRYLGGLLASRPVQRWLKSRIRSGAPGPSEGARARGVSRLYGAAGGPAGHKVRARLLGPEAYSFTAQTAVAALERVLAGEAKPGFQTPSLAFGPDFVLGIEGVQREDLSATV
ncbi:MAG TPA: saccharopine dehydrogenase NADP-binding domain-containing protein [Gemmatimonadales bacterium]|nr:saccharopine dehydrogenase NADP-binding domain-containing protein [Gemmatimonadales bacterium]